MNAHLSVSARRKVGGALMSLAVLSAAFAAVQPAQAAGIPKPTVKVDATLVPSAKTVIDPARGNRKLGRIKNSNGTTVDVVRNELLVAAPPDQLGAIADRLRGQLHDVVDLDPQPVPPASGGPIVPQPPTMLWGRIVIPSTALSTVSTKSLATELRSLSPVATGNVTVSSSDVLKLVAAMTHERAAFGSTVSLNYVTTASSISTGSATEGGGFKPFSSDLYRLSGALNIGVTSAWQALDIAKKAKPSVSALVVDGGFAPNGDVAINVIPATQTNVPGPETGKEWHGTKVSNALGGIIDNSLGGAGTGGQVVKVNGWSGNQAADFVAALDYAIKSGIRVVNASFIASIDSVLAGFSGDLSAESSAVKKARAAGVLTFASAGNFGVNVDAQNGSWEDSVTAPCELDEVICVAGLNENGTYAAASNYGDSKSGTMRNRITGSDNPAKQDNSIDLWAPFCLPGISITGVTAPALDLPGTSLNCGTSYSSPFVAGVAAMVMAADPGLTADQVFANLLDTAKQISTRYVGDALQIDARGAVLKALGPVSARMTAKGYQAGLSVTTVRLISTVDDAYDGLAQEASVRWSDSVDGFLGVGGSLEVELSSLGYHTITATYTNSQGTTTTRTFTMYLTEAGMRVWIASPVDGERLAKDLKYQLVGGGVSGSRPVTCQWSSSNPDDGPFPSGCTVPTVFTTEGTRSLTLTVSAPEATTESLTIAVTVLDADLITDRLFVSVWSPKGSATGKRGDLVSVDGSVKGGVAPYAYAWSWKGSCSAEAPMDTIAPTIWSPFAGPAFTTWDTTSLTGACDQGLGDAILTITDANGRRGHASVPFNLMNDQVPH